jgi:NAD-dependent dihydropyrimidine dehydrogenase PreA subunit
VDVCPWDCLKITNLNQLEGDDLFVGVVESFLGGPMATFLEENPYPLAVMLKDDEACTRCALCAERCPTDAITMEAFRFQEVLSLGEVDE